MYLPSLIIEEHLSSTNDMLMLVSSSITLLIVDIIYEYQVPTYQLEKLVQFLPTKGFVTIQIIKPIISIPKHFNTIPKYIGKITMISIIPMQTARIDAIVILTIYKASVAYTGRVILLVIFNLQI
jgi:hypothetical protein